MRRVKEKEKACLQGQKKESNENVLEILVVVEVCH